MKVLDPEGVQSQPASKLLQQQVGDQPQGVDARKEDMLSENAANIESTDNIMKTIEDDQRQNPNQMGSIQDVKTNQDIQKSIECSFEYYYKEENSLPINLSSLNHLAGT